MVSAVLFILLLGCTGTQQQPPTQQQSGVAAQEQANNASTGQTSPEINARTGANVENLTSPPQQQEQATCSLNLTPSTISPGGFTDIGYSVQSNDNNVVFTYNCGNQTLAISSGGLTNGFKLCQFDTPGNVDIWIKANGVVCAQQTLSVSQPTSNETCYIDPNSVTRDLVNHDYSAAVHFSGFPPQDVLTWTCDQTTATHVLGGSASGMPLYTNIYCDFTGQPTSGAIEVSIGNVSCGSISTG
jgi:hypothetical protein